MGRSTCTTAGEHRNNGGCSSNTWCSADKECDSNYCETGGAQTWNNSGGGICRSARRNSVPTPLAEGEPAPLAKGGEWCDDNQHCVSNECQVATRKGCKGRKASCTTAGKFRANSVEEGGCDQSTWCTVNDDCALGYCETGGRQTWAASGGGICRIAEHGKVPTLPAERGEWCDDSKHCSDDLVCKIETREGCAAGGPSGMECQKDTDCTSGACRDWTNFSKRCCPLPDKEGKPSGMNRWDQCGNLKIGDACKNHDGSQCLRTHKDVTKMTRQEIDGLKHGKCHDFACQDAEPF